MQKTSDANRALAVALARQSQHDIQKRALWTLLAMIGLLVALYGLVLFLSWKLNLNHHPEPKIASDSTPLRCCSSWLSPSSV